MAFLVFLVSASIAAPVLSDTFPPGFPDRAVIATWEHFREEAEADGERIAFELYVNPLRRGLYEITRFRISTETTPRQSPAHAPGIEILIWNAQPGKRIPVLCYERVPHRVWWTFWIWKRWIWKPIPVGTERYRREVLRTIQVYMLHRQTLGLPPLE